MTEHKHRAVPARSKDHPYWDCVNPIRPNPKAHGNITRLDFCQCGAWRLTNINQSAREYSWWRRLGTA